MNVIDSHGRETSLVREYFGDRPGFFVDVGANDPRRGSQSWHLEQFGWTGILIEPQPDLADRLRATRSAKVFAVACSSPHNAGRNLPLHLAGGGSSLDRERMAAGRITEKAIDVPVRTFDEILTEAGAPEPLDFLSTDIEGHELEVFSGFDFLQWCSRPLLVEDHVSDLSKLRFLRRARYRLVRHANNNGWCVPEGAPVKFGWRDRWEVLRKYYLALPFRIVRNASRRLRQPFKDRWAVADRRGH
jgi:FkbM family methyltransferase